MPRGKRTMSELLDEAKTEGNAPQIVENETKSQETPKPLLVNGGTPLEIVLKCDSEGQELLFAQNEDFLMLSEDVVRQLSRANRMRYSSARQFHETWRGAQDAEFAEAFSVDREFVGKAIDKLDDIEIRAGIQHRWARPDRVGHYAAKGYKILSADEAKTYLGPKGSHHEISKNGKTELVLMGIPKTIFDKRQAEKAQKNKERALNWKKSGVQQLAEAGAKGFTEGSVADARADWQDLESSN